MLAKLANLFAGRVRRLPTSYEYRIETPRQTLPESFCAGCIDDALADEAKKWPEEDRDQIYPSMSSGAEHDGRSHCDKCGLLLDSRLSLYGGEVELMRFAGMRFSSLQLPSDEDLYYLWKMMESLARHVDRAKIALALKLGRRVLTLVAEVERDLAGRDHGRAPTGAGDKGRGGGPQGD